VELSKGSGPEVSIVRLRLGAIVPDRALKILLTLLLLAFAAGVSGPASAANVAVILSDRNDDYQEALRGFKQTVRHPIIAEYNMAGDLERGRKILTEIETKVKPDLIFAIGLWALQAIVSQPTDIPVVYAMVLNPPSIVGAGSRNITGASMNVPVEQPLRLLKQLGPQIKRVGVIFNQARTGYLVKRAEAVAREEGLQLIAKEISSAKEAIAALESLQGSVDAIWILPDETTLAQTVVQQMLLFSYRNKIPLLGLSERHAQMGALLSLSFASSEDIGRQAGELASSILGGKTVADVPYTTARRLTLTVNLKAAQKLGVEIPKVVLGRATTVIQ
jgi:putative tryptophan/tyrosine transport system substrate-binding protein